MLRIVLNNVTKGIVRGEMFKNLDDRPFPARWLINMEKYTARDTIVPFRWIKASSIMTSLGCAFNCLYCINSKRAMFGKKVRYNSPAYVEMEVDHLVSSYGVDGLYFQDDSFTGWKKRTIEICKRIKRFDLSWFCASRVDSLNEELLSSLKSAGCGGIAFGVESGSPKVLRVLNKKSSIENTIKVFDLCRKHRIKTIANIMVGCPEETMADIELTNKLLERIKPDYVQISYVTPYEGTVLYDMALEKGWLRSDASFITDEPQIEINFTLRELGEIGKNFGRKFNPFFRIISPYLNRYFVYDMLRVLKKKPLLLFEGVHEWIEASRIYL